jgi:hypothetical protein
MGTETKQRKALDVVDRLLPPGVTARAFGAGRANARMTPQVTYLIVGFLVLLVVVAVLTGRILIPGVLVFALFFSAIKPMRGVAVADTVVVVVSLSPVSGKPNTVLGELPHAVLLPPHIHWVGQKAVQLLLGPDVVKLRARDYERLIASLGANDPGYSAPSAGTAAGWYPMNGDQYRQGYWNGSAWTAMKSWDGTAWADAVPSRP